MTRDGSTELLLRSMVDAIIDIRRRVSELEAQRTTQPESLSKLMEHIPTLREMFHGLLWLIPRAVIGWGMVDGWLSTAWHWVSAAIKALL
jgi:hypothetical protein